MNKDKQRPSRARDRTWRAWRRRPLLVARGALPLMAAVASAAAALSACGGGPPGAVARIATTAPATTTAPAAATTPTVQPTPSTGTPGSSRPAGSTSAGTALEFAQCMRSHGVSKFPDPGADGSFPGAQALGNIGIDTSSPTFQAAQKACQSLLPAGPQPSSRQVSQSEQEALKFAQCVRSHGVPSFPDPKFNTSSGGLSITISGPGSGVDVGSPIVQAAMKACRQYMLPGPSQR